MALQTTILLSAALSLALTSIGPEVRRAAAAETAAVPAAADLQVLLNTVRANRRALVSVNLNLSATEATQFWPLYEQYHGEINAIGDRVLALVEEYAANYRTLSDEKAMHLMTAYLAAEAERVKVRQVWLPKFAAIIPGRTVARFYQIENKIDAVVRFELAASIPVVGGDAVEPAP
jgi:hypothetical protein